MQFTLFSKKEKKGLAVSGMIKYDSVKYLDYKTSSFVSFFSSRDTKIFLCVVTSIFILSFCFLKWQFPHANYMPDSFSYLEAANSNADLNTWPVGYSKFLRLISVFTHSETLVVLIQYLFLQLSSYILVLSFIYFLSAPKWIRISLLLFVSFNPIALYMANYISADAVFVGVSLMWFTNIIWLVYRPRLILIFSLSILILIAFVLRYNAIYYPFVSGIAIVIAALSWKHKVTGLLLVILFPMCSYLYTSSQMKKLTGISQFSAFGGWQLANNSIYMYSEIPKVKRKQLPKRFAELDAMVQRHLDTLNRVKFSAEDSTNLFYYLWNPNGPLHKYLAIKWSRDSTTPQFERWARQSIVYQAYGNVLLRTYPIDYLHYWMAPNAIRYYVPPGEFLSTYNMGLDSVAPIVKYWFHLNSLKIVDQKSKKKVVVVNAEIMPVVSAMVNILYLFSLIGILIARAFKRTDPFYLLSMIVFSLFLTNFLFSVFASCIVLRYQYLPMLILLPIGLYSIWKLYYILEQSDELKKKTNSL